MSDEGDETIDADPEALQSLKDLAAEEHAAEEHAAEDLATEHHAAALGEAAGSAPEEPLHVWLPGDAGSGRAADPEDVTVSLDAVGGSAPTEPLSVWSLSSVDDELPIVIHAPTSDEATEADPDGEDLADGGEVDALAVPVVARIEADAPQRDDVEDAAPPSASPAREFIAEQQERVAKATVESSAHGRTRPSGMWIAVAVVLGAQILAGGVYLALNTLRDDTTEVETALGEQEVVAEEGITVVEPTAPPLPTAAPTPVGTPTPVPPTPTWRPVDNGPRSVPFTFFVEATVNQPRFYRDRDGELLNLTVDGSEVPLTSPLTSGGPLVLRAVGGVPGDEWAQVELPGDATVAWIRSEDFFWNSTTFLVQIDLFTNMLRVFDENTAVFESSIATGTRSRPTPQLSTYVLEEIAAVDGRLRLAGFGDRGARSDGLGSLTIEPAAEPSSSLRDEDGYTTDGRILMFPSDFLQLAELVAPGSKVEIVGLPAAPAATPAPDASAVPDETDRVSEGGSSGCPVGAEGTEPNCYRVVDRTTLPGECPGREIAIEGDCYILGGNPVLDAIGRSCPLASPVEINELCYLRRGRIPELPGPCPAGSREIRGECRQPV